MIAKQYLLSGMLMALIAAGLSLLFRLQLGWPDRTFPWLETLLGEWGKGYGLAFPEHAELLAVLPLLGDHVGLPLCREWTSIGRMDNLSSAQCLTAGGTWLGIGDDAVVDFDGLVHSVGVDGGPQLHHHDSEHAYPGHENDPHAANGLVLLLYGDFGGALLPGFIVCRSALGF